jgi:hypothetical protein
MNVSVRVRPIVLAVESPNRKIITRLLQWDRVAHKTQFVDTKWNVVLEDFICACLAIVRTVVVRRFEQQKIPIGLIDEYGAIDVGVVEREFVIVEVDDLNTNRHPLIILSNLNKTRRRTRKLGS